MQTFNPTVAPDGESIQLDIKAQLTTHELDLLLLTLSQRRAEMLPIHPTDPRKAMAVATEPLPMWAVEVLDNHQVRLAVRSSGYGWLYFQMDAERMAGLANLIAQGVSSAVLARSVPPTDAVN